MGNEILSKRNLGFFVSVDEAMRVCNFDPNVNSAFMLLQSIELVKVSVEAKYPFCFEKPGITSTEKPVLLAELKELLDGVRPAIGNDYCEFDRNRKTVEWLDLILARHSWGNVGYKIQRWWYKQKCYELQTILNGLHSKANIMPDTRAIYIAIKEAIIDRD